MHKVIEFEGKRYPRYWGEEKISLSEAMARTRSKTYTNHSPPTSFDQAIILHTNLTDVPEGIQELGVRGLLLGGDVTSGIIIWKRFIEPWLKERDLPCCDEPDLMAEKKLAVELKEKKANELKPVSAAATFALEQVKDEPDDAVNKELCLHWRSQEHAYLVAQSEAESAREEIRKAGNFQPA